MRNMLVRCAFVATLGAVVIPHLAGASVLTYYTTTFDTDWAYSGISGVRNDGYAQSQDPATINLSGVSGNVSKAYLYWHGPSNSTDVNRFRDIKINGNAITGTWLGTADDNCWGFNVSYAYRADVTAYVTGNGAYTVSNYARSDSAVNGFSLVAFFDDGNDANNRDVVMFDGNDSNIVSAYDPAGWDVTLSGINYTSGNARMVLGVADGQSFLDDAIKVNGNVLQPAGQIFAGTSLPYANAQYASNSNGGMWDIKSWDVTSYLSPGQNSLRLTSGTWEDCLGLVHVMIDLPAGAAPPPIPEPASIIVWSLLAALAVTLVSWRKRKAG